MTLSATENRAEWLARRRDGITATDVSAIIGLNPWKTPLQVWNDKVNPEADTDLSDREPVEWGNRLEPMVAEKFADRHPEFIVHDTPGLVAGPHEWMLCTPDRMLTAAPPEPFDENDPLKLHTHPATPGVLEIKTAGARQAFRWDDEETPDEYVIQLMWQMAVTGAQVGWIAALIAGQRYVEREYDRDEALIHMLISKAEAFRNDHVLAMVAPIADPWKDAALLSHIYRVEQGAVTDLSDESRLALAHLEQLKSQRKEIDDQIAECEATIKQNLGEAEIGLIDDEPAVTWKQSERKGYTVKPSTVRTLRVVKRKEPSDG